MQAEDEYNNKRRQTQQQQATSAASVPQANQLQTQQQALQTSNQSTTQQQSQPVGGRTSANVQNVQTGLQAQRQNVATPVSIRSNSSCSQKIIKSSSNDRYVANTSPSHRYRDEKHSERYSQTDRYDRYPFSERSPSYNERYSSCYISPPSPAPNNDRFERFTTPAERFLPSASQNERFLSTSGPSASSSDRYSLSGNQNDRFVPISNPATNTAERFSSAGTQNERYSTTSGQTERFISTSGQTGTTSERFPTSGNQNERFLPSSSQTVAPTDRFGTSGSQSDRFLSTSGTAGSNNDRFTTQNDRFAPSSGTNDRYAGSNTGNDRFVQSAVQTDRYSSSGGTNDRFVQTGTNTERYISPAPPNTERFVATAATSDRYTSQPVQSDRFAAGSSAERFVQPSAASERYIQPSAPSTERYSSTTTANERFTAQIPSNERFAAPPSLSPAHSDRFNPLERYRNNSPNPERFNTIAGTTVDRYRNTASPKIDKIRQSPKTADRYNIANSTPIVSNERYNSYGSTDRFLSNSIDRYSLSENERFNTSSNERFIQTDRYIPPNAHIPVERYVPSPENYNYSNFTPNQTNYAPNSNIYERYVAPNFNSNNGDPYMRRDLGYHHHYRLQNPSSYQYNYRLRSVPRLKCCSSGHFQSEQFLLPSASPGSSSNSSVGSTTNFVPQQQQQRADFVLPAREYIRELPPNLNFTISREYVRDFSPVLTSGNRSKTPTLSCKHNSTCSTPSIEYLGASGGRVVSAAPSTTTGIVCDQTNCCSRRNSAVLPGTNVWRTPSLLPTPQVNAAAPSSLVTVPVVMASQPSAYEAPSSPAPPPATAQIQHAIPAAASTSSPVQRTVSMPVPSTVRITAHIPAQNLVHQQPSSSHEPLQQQHIRQQPMQPRRQIQYTMSERLPTRERPTLERSMSRKEQVKRFIKRETATFFGVDEISEEGEQQRWLDRRKRLASRRYGRLKDEFELPEQQQSGTLSRYSGGHPGQLTGGAYRTSGVSPREPREQVPHADRTSSSWPTEPLPSVAGGPQPGGSAGQGIIAPGGRPDILPEKCITGDMIDGEDVELRNFSKLRRKDSVARLTLTGIGYVVNTITRHRPRPRSQVHQWSRSFAPEEVSLAGIEGAAGRSPDLDEELFFQNTVPDTVDARAPTDATRKESSSATPGVVGDGQPSGRVTRSTSNRHAYQQAREQQQNELDRYNDDPYREERDNIQTERDRDIQLQHERDRANSWRRSGGVSGVGGSGDMRGASRISSPSLNGVEDNSNRRKHGIGILGKVFGRKAVRHSRIPERASGRHPMDDMEDYRPFFTYWVTTVQILVLVISLICYGLGPFGVDLANRSGQVLVTSLSLQQVDYQEPANFWLGPRAADLIHLGAKFAPCMRRDTKIIQGISKGRQKERETACCIRNDDSGCVQSSQADCSKTISTWKKWSAGDAGPGGRISGSVCGLDPKFCDAPASVAPYEWPDDITKWPICRKTNSFPQRFRYKDKIAEHMICEVIGHPCCIGIHGMCRITTREYCDFVKGYFHEEASLCAQVACLDDVCGMISFFSPELPDQFYRLWTSLFLHAGVIHLIITILIQYFLMRDLEKLAGSLRMGIIYIGSGVAGNLASAIFVPYRAEVGPAGAQFGLLACLIVEVLNVWPMLRRPKLALTKLLAVTFALFAVGLLPWVDNYAHLFGFVFGFLLSYALMPFVSFGIYDRHKKIALIWVCLLSAFFLFVCLIILFYVIPVYDCEICGYFNCLPLTRDLCASQNINFKREEPVV